MLQVKLINGEGKEVDVPVMVDDGAMIAAMDSSMYRELHGVIGGWSPLQRQFCMANGTLVKGEACWDGHVSIAGAVTDGSFEVFDSGGSWWFLFGKPPLEHFRVVHDYAEDTIKVEGERRQKRLVFNGGLGKRVDVEVCMMGMGKKQDLLGAFIAVSEQPEGSVNTASRVIKEILTPLYREVSTTAGDSESVNGTNGLLQGSPRSRPTQMTMEEVKDEELGCSPLKAMDAEELVIEPNDVDEEEQGLLLDKLVREFDTLRMEQARALEEHLRKDEKRKQKEERR
ncbi:hypothetical protein GYMLUDRAFT_248408 [Collybiopsis luxurians FD-317 M1]|uniref:Unplaced genomic scaffold GYMLUscaffold_55, whole genome shotgun sequence n=1 Tax=Collybiopsis luxurians FD-317 M1 TaxID=944289 RepID=A0A0D0AYN6_9AGAR|nr:hypothetical protein GYMLUDRAFT_248408 [Collybiopsis luxurians FD-317 M1]